MTPRRRVPQRARKKKKALGPSPDIPRGSTVDRGWVAKGRVKLEQSQGRFSPVTSDASAEVEYGE